MNYLEDKVCKCMIFISLLKMAVKQISRRTFGLYLLMQMHVKFDVGVRKVLPEGQERPSNHPD